jgi:Ni/Co efflux regulator RcnB
MGLVRDASVTSQRVGQASWTERGQIDLTLTRSLEAPMDQMLRPDEQVRIDSGGRTVSRRRFFSRARLSLIAVAGVAVFGIATTTAGVVAKEDSDEEKEEKEKKEKQKVRDKDREAKEKEKESKNKNKENGSNTKKKKKNTNGDDRKKKKKQENSVPESPYRQFVVNGQDRYGCSNLANQWDAQQILRLDPRDPNGLDGNRNGIACDGQDAFVDGVAGGLMSPPFDLSPVKRP